MKKLVQTDQIQEILDRSGFLKWFSFDVLPYLQVTEYEKSEYVIRGDQPLTKLYYLVAGSVKLNRIHKNGRQSLIDFFRPPCILGEAELFEADKLPSPLITLTPCVFLEVDMCRCRPLLLSDAQFLRELCGMMLKRRVAQNRKYLNLAAYPSRNNLAVSLLALENEGIFSEKYTEIADYLSVSYRHLMHLIAQLCDEGTIERVPQGLRILNWDRLRELSGEIGD